MPSFDGLDGLPLTAGYVYIGQPNLDPRQYPSDVFFDSNLTIPASQPLRTQAGYLFRNGSPTNVWMGEGYHSLMVTDFQGRQVFYAAAWLGAFNTTIREAAVDVFSGTGAPATYTLSVTPSSIHAVDVYVAGTHVAESALTLVGNQLTLTAAAGTDNVLVKTSTLLDYSALVQVAADAATSASSAHADLLTVQGITAQFGDVDAAITAAETAQAAAEASEAAAATSEANAAGSASAAATSAAKTLFTTVALGHSGSADGQTFNVVQSNGEGADTYLHSGAADVWQSAGAVGELALAEMVERIQPETYAPVVSMLSWQTALQNGRGALNSARPKSRVFGRNLYAYVYGPRSQGTTTLVTPFFANGPTKTGTASRFLATVVGDLFRVWTSAYRPPAGTYTIDFQVKSNTGSDQAIRTGNASQGYTARTAAAASWLHVQQQITTTGSDWASFDITGDGTNTPDILIDEMRIYEDTTANVPAIASDPQGDDFMPILAVRKTRHTGRLLDNTASTAEGAGVLRVQGYPTAKVFTECTLIAAAALSTSAASQQLLTTDTTTALGTTNTTLGIISGAADGSPDFTGVTSFFDYEMTGQGVVVLALTVKDGARSGYVDAVEIGSGTGAFAGFSARMFRMGSNSTLEVGYSSTFRWQGLIGAGKVFDRYLRSDEIAVEVAKVKAGLRAAGIAVTTPAAFVVALGDSQASSGSGARGPSWAYLQADAGAFTPNMPVRVLALGGKTSQQLVSEQLPVTLLMIEQALAAGIRLVASIFTATNNQDEIVTDWNGGVSPFTSPTGWWETTKATLIDPIVAAGGKVTFATPLPDGGSPPANWESARVALQAKIIADYTGSTDVFVMDFGGTAGVSTVADTAGANYDTDHRHLTTAGHLVLKPVVTAAINAALDAP